jgi:hypothetical protein
VGALGARAVSLVTSGVVPERRFAFFDQVHPWGSTLLDLLGILFWNTKRVDNGRHVRHILTRWGPQDSVQLRYGCG